MELFKLWVDDERPMPEEYNAHAFTSQQAINMLEFEKERGLPFDLISFDHDLGMLDGEDRDDTSRRVLTWMIEHAYWPREVRVHTANPTGREWLLGTAVRYAPFSVFVNEADPWRDPPGMRMG